MKRIFASLLTCVLLLGLLPLKVRAETAGPFTVTGGEQNTDYKYENNALTILTSEPLTISNNSETSDNIVVKDGVSANLTLAGVKIKTSGRTEPSACPLYLNNAGPSTIILQNGTENVLDGSGTSDFGPGIWVPEKNLLTISGEGVLSANGGNYWPGIGRHSNGNIQIEGGSITAKGGDSAAGIGGSSGNAGGAITINGGTVTAKGGGSGAGIGGGSGASGGSITINKGSVTARGHDYAAGIGGGIRGNGGSITINDGSIYAEGANAACGIGGGGNTNGRDGGSGGTITINGGTITAKGAGVYAAAIGGGRGASGGSITLNGGMISAEGGRSEISGNRGVGIGNGGGGYGAKITTGADGTAFIKANSISGNTSGLTSCIYFNGNDGRVCGNQTLDADLTLTPDQWLTVANNATLTVPSGITLTNNGKISLYNTGTIMNSGAIANNGTVSGGGTVTGSGTYSGKKITPIVKAPTANRLVYTSQAQELVSAGGTNGGTLQYSTDGTNYSTEIPKETNAGDHTVYYKVIEDTYYANVGPKSVSVTISKATPTPTEPGSLTATYGQTLADVSLPTGWAWHNSSTSVGTVGMQQFPATFTPSDTANYENVTQNLTVEVQKATVPTPTPQNLNIANALSNTYTFALSNLRPQVQEDWGTVSYEIEVNFTEAGYYNGDAAIIADPSGALNTLSLPILFNEVTTVGEVGTVTVTIKSDNYNDFTNTIKILASNKKTVTFGGIKGVTAPYTGQPVKGYTGALVITDDNGNLVTLTPEISYIGRLTTSYQGDVPPTNAGTYFVVLQAADTDQNYIGRQAIPFEIIKAAPIGEPKHTAITTSGKTLSDAALTVEGGAFSVPGTVTWELDDTTAIEANTAYKWIFTPADTDNYTTLEGSITLWQHANGSTPPTYKPEVSQPGEGGAVSVTPSRPERGDTVTVKPKPDEGYEVDKITVTDKDGKPVEVTVKPDGTYTFKQPNGKVKIEVTYKPIETSWSNPFTDLAEDDWYYEAVRFVQEQGLMNGYSDGRFGANDALSRAQLAQILFNKEGRPGVDQLLDFSDVSGEAWYTEAVRWAASQGIAGGYGNGAFGPNDPITREQLAVMLWRYSGSPAATDKELHFNDTDEISGYALEAMRWAVENGILNGDGDGRLGPQGQATRAQAAQMLKNFFEKG